MAPAALLTLISNLKIINKTHKMPSAALLLQIGMSEKAPVHVPTWMCEWFMVCEIDAYYRPCIQVQITINFHHRFMSRLKITH